MPSTPNVARRLRFTLLLVGLAGCEGEILPAGPGVSAPSRPTPTEPGGGGAGGPARPFGVLDCSQASAAPGHWALRRLTNAEYTHTVQDLLFTQQAPGATFQDSPVGTTGFTNDALALSVYPSLVAGYSRAATALAQELKASKGVAGGAWSRVVTCDAAQPSCATDTVRRLARRALRRQVGPADLEGAAGLMTVFRAAGTFDQGLYDVTVALLVHPEFIFIPVVDAASLDPAATFALDGDELAARLSYFLWQSMPDDALFAAAEAGTLGQPDVLAAQVRRMLQHPRAAHLKEVLRDELAGLGPFALRDFTLLGQTNALRDLMIRETDAFFDDLVSQDKSALTVLSGTQTFASKALADFYGLPFPAGVDPARFVPIAAPRRVGLGSHGAVLANTSGGTSTTTNPIKRGHFIVKKLMCDEPPPPPPGVPPLPAATGPDATLKERLDAHLSAPQCAACHRTMDNVGFGAESFDPLGRLRTTYADGSRVDASGVLPDGTAFADGPEMFSRLAEQASARRCMAEQFFALALSRPPKGLAERCAAQAVAQASVTPQGRLSDLVVGVASSPQFLNQTGEAP